MASFMSFCAGFMMGMSFILSVMLSLLGPLFLGLSFLIVYFDVSTQGEKKGTESDSVFMTCVDCGTTENVNEVGLCSFCEEDREQQEEGEMNHE
jgi:hypothetical protein